MQNGHTAGAASLQALQSAVLVLAGQLPTKRLEMLPLVHSSIHALKDCLWYVVKRSGRISSIVARNMYSCLASECC